MKNSPLAILSASGISAASISGSSICELLHRGHTLFRCSEGTGGNRLAGYLPENAEKELNSFCSSSKLLKRHCRVTQLAAYVAHNALDQDALDQDALARFETSSSTAVIAGSSRGATATLENSFTAFLNTGTVPPLTSPTTTLGCIASTVAQIEQLTGEVSALSATCTSGLATLLHASALLHTGEAERCLAIGTEAPLTPFTFAQMEALGVLAKNDSLSYPCKPLANSLEGGEGIILGEGAAALLLARGDALHSDTQPLGIISAVHSVVEASPSPTAISPKGNGFQQAMGGVLRKAQVQRPDLILAHAPGTKNGDTAEQYAIESLFEGTVPPVYSPKWLFGHTFGASGLLSVLLALELLQGGALPPFPYPSTWNEKLPIQGDSLNHILINTAGFGGLTTSAIVSRFRGNETDTN